MLGNVVFVYVVLFVDWWFGFCFVVGCLLCCFAVVLFCFGFGVWCFGFCVICCFCAVCSLLVWFDALWLVVVVVL